jgi:hypothetical protein
MGGTDANWHIAFVLGVRGKLGRRVRPADKAGGPSPFLTVHPRWPHRDMVPSVHIVEAAGHCGYEEVVRFLGIKGPEGGEEGGGRWGEGGGRWREDGGKVEGRWRRVG